mmetsp:Transcript_88768/g.259430  ORF Transcript_88768/g.259430 Transcript_88768/m.259430 type:complete len:85 (-) Transcript_88768:629-883(-)
MLKCSSGGQDHWWHRQLRKPRTLWSHGQNPKGGAGQSAVRRGSAVRRSGFYAMLNYMYHKTSGAGLLALHRGRHRHRGRRRLSS